MSVIKNSFQNISELELLPFNWRNRYNNNACDIIELAKNDEYKQIERYFTSEKRHMRVTRIERIENKHAYLAAMIAKEKYIFIYNRNPNESLYIKSICTLCKPYFIKNPDDSRKICNCLPSNLYLVCAKIGLYGNCAVYPKYVVTATAPAADMATAVDKCIAAMKSLGFL